MKKPVLPGIISDEQLRKLSQVYSDFFEDVSSLASKGEKASTKEGQTAKGSSSPSSAGTGRSSSAAPRPAASSASVKKASSASDSGPSSASKGPASAKPSTPTASAVISQAGLPTAAAVSTGQPEVEKKAEPEEDPMESLDKLIGLETIKKDVKELMAFVKIQKAREASGLKSVPVSLHLVFTGNPGTGKTTVARIIAKLYKQIGVLSQGQLIEVDRSGLVAGYVGQTAIKTQEQISKALGGILFIDEAYALSQKDDAFGQEAIETILKAMEDHRDNLVVIVAGYTEPMEDFINSNPGLKSRFNKYIEFPDYTMDELMGIFDMNCKKYDYTIDEDTRKHVREFLSARKLAQLENFANARDVRNLFEEIITNQAVRVSAMEKPSQEDMMRICQEDLDDVALPKNRDEEDPLAAFMHQLASGEKEEKKENDSAGADPAPGAETAAEGKDPVPEAEAAAEGKDPVPGTGTAAEGKDPVPKAGTAAETKDPAAGVGAGAGWAAAAPGSAPSEDAASLATAEKTNTAK